ncbi:Ltp family lipoprotein [Clostridium sp. B9]|uniref:Ltp family lipoprotein n=1 Tax=Clostridium sp. B9 TaxID=3423224 RepID=UPI003D2F3306
MAKIKKCRNCSKKIASNAKSCPECGEKNKKVIYKRPWFIVAASFIVIGLIGVGCSEEPNTLNNELGKEISQNQNTEANQKQETENNGEEEKETIVEEDNTQDVLTEKEPEENVPSEHKSALKKAKTYSDMMHMSKVGLYDQLTSEYGEQFTEEAAQYAIDNIEADWKENALKKAKTYSDTMSMSKAGLYDQLISEYGEKFTPEEAQYAVDNVEADWNENALKKAKTYQETMAMSPSAIYDQLISEYGEKFTPEEAQYAIDNLN